MRLVFNQPHWDAMRMHVGACAPLEGCGLLAGKGDSVSEVLLIANTVQSPVRFRMDPSEQLRAFDWMESHGLDLVGIFHSHPAGPEGPSPTDIAEAAYEVVQVIWMQAGGRWQARGFWIENKEVAEVELRIKAVE